MNYLASRTLGKSPEEAKALTGYATETAKIKEKTTWLKHEAATNLLKLWERMIESEPESAPSWRDVLRASELTARYFGLIKDGDGAVNNVLVLNASDAKQLTEQELLAKLSVIHREKEQLSLETQATSTAPTLEEQSSDDTV